MTQELTKAARERGYGEGDEYVLVIGGSFFFAVGATVKEDVVVRE
jgi:hypothetical protein